MTTVTALLGMLPLAILGGPGVELRRAVAVAVTGGLITATLGTLFVVPLLYRFLDRGATSEEPDTQDISARAMRRLVPAAAVILLAIATARSIQLHYAPALSLPELTVQLTMPAAAATDPIETTTRWIVPVESSIRSLGDVLAMRGEIATDTATITVRFRRGIDPELKVARLASELAGLRARLPRDARLAVWPSAQSGARPSAFLALTGAPDAARRVADELRTVAGARDVEVYGGTDIETEVRLARGQRIAPEDLIDAIVPHHLGTTPHRRAPDCGRFRGHRARSRGAPACAGRPGVRPPLRAFHRFPSQRQAGGDARRSSR